MKKVYKLKNLDNPNTAIEIEDSLSIKEGVVSVALNYSTSSLYIETNYGSKEPYLISSLIRKIDKNIRIINPDEYKNNVIAFTIIFIGIGLTLGTLGLVLDIKLLILLSYILIQGNSIIREAVYFKERKYFNQNIINILASIAIFITHRYLEGLILITVLEISNIIRVLINYKYDKYFEDSLIIDYDLVDIKRSDNIIRTSPESIQKGDIIITRVGEIIPIDGNIVKGTATINTEFQTGKSNMIKLSKGDYVLSGNMVLNGLLEIEATTDFEHSIANRTINILNDSINTPLEKNRFIKTIKSTSLLLIIISFIYLLISTLVFSKDIEIALYNTLSILLLTEVTSSIISIPIIYNIVVLKLSKIGIIIKNHNTISSISKIREIIFNNSTIFSKKKNKDYVLKVLNKKYNKDEILDYYAKSEQLAGNIYTDVIGYYEIPSSRRGIRNYELLKHNIIYYECNKDKIYVGDYHLLDTKKKDDYIYLKINNKIVAKLTTKENVKEDTINTIEDLKNNNIKTILYTTQDEHNVKAIVSDLNIDEIKYKLNFDDKYLNLKEEIIHNKNITCLIGSTKNDVSSLELADIGISLYGIDNPITTSSDIVFKDGELNKLIELINNSNKANNRIKSNIILSLIIKLILLILIIIGINKVFIIPIISIILYILTTIRVK